MQHLSTAFLIFALVIAVNQDGVKAQAVEINESQDQIAEEAKHRAVTIVEGPKYVAPPPAANTTSKPEPTPPSKPPITPTPDNKHNKPKYVELPRIYYGQIQKLPPNRHYNKPLKIQPPTNVYKYHKVIPLHQIRGHQNSPKHQQLVYAASTSKPSVINNKSPKFNLPVETVNGIRADFVRPPPHFFNINTTTTTTTTTPTTTTKYIRTKRIWPKHIPNRMNVTSTNSSVSANKTSEDLSGSASQKIIKYVYANGGGVSSTASPSTKGPYRRVTRVPKKKPTTPQPDNHTRFEQNDWVPIIPSHYTINKVRKIKQTPILSRRSDVSYNTIPFDKNSISKSFQDSYNQRMLFLQSFGLIPMASSPHHSVFGKKNVYVYGKNKKPQNVSGYRKKPVQTSHVIREYPFDAADPKIITRIKHHHHHHHHKYVKTVEKPVRVEVPKPVPVPVPMPVPVRVEQKVPYPVQVKVPHPVPVKVIQKEYVPKPYPVIQHVPVIKRVEVKVPQPYPVEKRVPYPVEIQVPVDKPYPVPVPVEKRVPVPVPVRVLVPQPYPVETKVPYPVKEPVEVIKHVPVKIPYPEPYPVRVPVKIPFPVEKKVPFPIEVEKKVPVPYPVKVPHKVEVERKVPVFISRPMPFEKKVPVPVKVPYPVRVPIRVPYGVPIMVHPSPSDGQDQQNNQDANSAFTNSLLSHYAYSVNGNSVTQYPQNTVTLHGNGAQSSVTVHGKPNFSGFQSRIDNFEETTTSNPVTTPDSTTHPGLLIIVTTEAGTQSLSEDNNSTTTTTIASR